MKILHLTYDDIGNPWCGGGGALRVFKVNEYLAENNDIIVVTGNYPNAKNETIGNVKFVRIGINSSYLLSRLSYSFLAPFFIHKFQNEIVVNDCSYFAPCYADIYTKNPVVNIIHHKMGKNSLHIYPLMGFFPFFAEKFFLKTIKNLITSSEEIRQDIRTK